MSSVGSDLKRRVRQVSVRLRVLKRLTEKNVTDHIPVPVLTPAARPSRAKEQ